MTGSFDLRLAVDGRYRSRYRQSSLVGWFSRTPVGSNCVQAGAWRVASRVCVQPAAGTGGRNRRALIGGRAYGRPRNWSAPAARTPRTAPCGVFTTTVDAACALAGTPANTAASATAIPIFLLICFPPSWGPRRSRHGPRLLTYGVVVDNVNVSVLL